MSRIEKAWKNDLAGTDNTAPPLNAQALADFEDDITKSWHLSNENRSIQLTGGGVFSWNLVSNSKFRWTGTLEVGPVPDRVNTANRITALMPTTSVENHLGVNQATADGITIATGEALWMTFTRGGVDSASVDFTVIPYSHNLSEVYFDREDAFVVAWRNANVEDDNLYLANGVIIEPGDRVISSGGNSQGSAGSIAYKQSVRAATTGLLPTFTPTIDNVLTATANGVIPPQDGVTLAVGDRFLVKNETGAYSAYNGWYIVTSVGSATTPWVLRRAADANNTDKFPVGSQSLITEGTTQAGQVWRTNSVVTMLNSSFITFQIYNPGGEATLPNASAATKGVVLVDAAPVDVASPMAVSVTSPAMLSHLDGLEIRWNSPGTNASHVIVDSGSAYIPSLGRVLEAPSILYGQDLVLAANTMYFVYLYSNAGVADIEVSTTAPAAPYRSGARTMTGFDSRRYLGSIRTDASGRAFVTRRYAGKVLFNEHQHIAVAPFDFMNAQTPATTGTVYALGSTHTAVERRILPPTSKILICYISTGTGITYFSNSEDNIGAVSQGISTSGTSYVYRELPLNSAQELIAAGGGTVHGVILGYYEDR